MDSFGPRDYNDPQTSGVGGSSGGSRVEHDPTAQSKLRELFWSRWSMSLTIARTVLSFGIVTGLSFLDKGDYVGAFEKPVSTNEGSLCG